MTNVFAYVPTMVVAGQTGGEKQALSARAPYFLRNNVTSLGATQEVRLLWLVQLLDDNGNIQIIHTDPNEGWKLGGLSARQDLGVHSAVLYQNPTFNDAGNQASACRPCRPPWPRTTESLSATPAAAGSRTR